MAADHLPAFAHFSRFGRGRVVRAQIESPTYAATYFDPRGAQDLFFPLSAVPYLKLAAVHENHSRTLTLFALNRSLVNMQGLLGCNWQKRWSRALPISRLRLESGADRARWSGGHLQPVSWNVIRMQAARPAAAASLEASLVYRSTQDRPTKLLKPH